MRPVPSALQTFLDGGNVAPVILVDLVFDSGTLRVTMLGYDITWGGNVYKGVGTLGKIDPITETETGEIVGLKFTLAGVDAAFVSTALQEPFQGRTVTVYFGGFALPQYTIIPDPIVEWAGTLDVPVIKDNNDGTCTIEVNAEHELYDFDHPQGLNYTDTDQQKLFPGDLGLQYAEKMATKAIEWPSAEFFKQ